MRRSIFIMGIMGALVLAGGVASANANDQAAQDQQFVKKAYSINLGEVKLGELAQQKGTSPAVKDYAQRMVQDHQQALSDLRQAAQKDDVTLPTELAPKEQNLYKQLSQKSGPQFDQAYLQHMKAGHKEAIDTFQKEARNGTKPELKQYAQKTLPTLHTHEQLATQKVKQLEQEQAAPTTTMPGEQQGQPMEQQGQPVQPQEQQPIQPENPQPIQPQQNP